MRDESSWTRLKQGISQDLQRGWNQLNPARARVRDVWRSLSFPYKLLFVVVVIGFLAILARQGFSRDVLTFAALSQAPWLIGMGIGFVLVMVLFLLWRLPKRKAARLDLGLKEQFDVENETRKTWATIVGGMAVLFSLVFTWANLQVTQENLRITQEAASKSQDLTRQGQITDRFTKAIAQLGEHAPEKLAIRLGGIYALERIARDSERDYWPIMEVLTAYVREHAPWPPKSPKDMTPPQDNPSPRWRITPQHQPATDIQAVLTVLGRRTPIYAPLDLRGTDLRGADLEGAYLEDANLRDAHLEEATLARAYLGGADLLRAHLEGAQLGGAHLKNAQLWFAHLEGAKLTGAYLQRANFSRAHLEGANLQRAHLEGADLLDTYLQKANLHDAHLEGANLRGAHLEGARNLTVEQLSTVRTLYKAHLDPPLLEQIQQQYPHLLEKPQN